MLGASFPNPISGTVLVSTRALIDTDHFAFATGWIKYGKSSQSFGSTDQSDISTDPSVGRP
jgi:hypothetical protein